MKEKLLAIWTSLKTFVSTQTSRVISYIGRITTPAFALAFIAGIVYVIVKYRDLLMKYILWSSKKDIDTAQKTDDALKQKEDAINSQANQLIDQANNLTNQDPDWYLKK